MSNKKKVLMQGNEAAVEGAIAAGMRFFAGYPITPSTEIAEGAARRLPMVGGHFLQMEDEIGSMAAVIGAAAAGAKAMTATSGPGFSLKQENLGYACFTEIPCVVVDVQRVGPSTGMPTSPAQQDVMQARWGTHGDHPIIALSPSSVLECYTLMIRAFNLAEKYRNPVIFLMDEIVGHMREGVLLPEPEELEIVERAKPDKNDESWKPYQADPETGVPVLPPFGEGWRYHITGLTHDERGYPTSVPEKGKALMDRLMYKIQHGYDDIVTVEEESLDDADVAVVCFGGTVRAVQPAVHHARRAGVKAGILRLVTIWPFADQQILALSKKVKTILVVEHNYGQIVHEVERAAQGNCKVAFMGCYDGSVIMPDDIEARIREVAEHE